MININDKILDQLDEQELFLVLHIARHIGKSGVAWPGVKRLMMLTKWTKPTVLKVRGRLYDKAIVKPTKRVDETGRDKSTVYRLCTPHIGIYMGSDTIADNGGKGDLPQGKGNLQGRVKDIYPEGKGDLPEVLTIESINKREMPTPAKAALSPSDADSFIARHSAPKSDPDHFGTAGLPAFEGGTENDYASVYGRIAEHLNGSSDWKGIAGLAKCTMTGEEFKEELQAWIRHFMNKQHLYKKPVQSLRGGPISFINWLRKPWAQEKYNAATKAKQIQSRKGGPVRRTITTA
jgi:hypothetical protein